MEYLFLFMDTLDSNHNPNCNGCTQHMLQRETGLGSCLLLVGRPVEAIPVSVALTMLA